MSGGRRVDDHAIIGISLSLAAFLLALCYGQDPAQCHEFIDTGRRILKYRCEVVKPQICHKVCGLLPSDLGGDFPNVEAREIRFEVI